MKKYRCPNCSFLNSIKINRIFDGRLLFICEKCEICSVLPFYNNIDETYLVFLDKFDNGYITVFEDLKVILENEKIVRPRKEIEKMLKKSNINSKLLNEILYSELDYLVDVKKLKESKIDIGKDLDELPLDDILVNQLKSKNIKKLFKFQEEAILNILRNKDTVIIAPTASGKTEAFCIPILQKIYDSKTRIINKKNQWFNSKKEFRTEGIKAIFVYPTKALARDQLSKIIDYSKNLDIVVKIFDGDLTENEKQNFYEFPPDIVLTNFDSIHYHLLNNTKFIKLLNILEFLVVDEVHVYTGIFGSNVHYIIQRLERIINNKKLQIIACSATLPNVREFCDLLFSREMEIIIGEGKRSHTNFAIIYPSLRSNKSLVIELIKKITKYHKTLVFSNSHISAELIAFTSAKQGIKIGVHRAGLPPKNRKIVENSFKSKKIDVISSTPTLELGIDIGDVDAVISNLVPINRLIQRLGRAARKGQEGYAFLTLGNDPISQYYKNHPDDYFIDQEIPYIDPLNPIIMENQILAMCYDRPISKYESKNYLKVLCKLEKKELLKFINGRYIPNLSKHIVLKNYNIRGIGNDVNIVFNGKIIGNRNLPQALEELHDDAIYFLSGKRYKVKKLTIDENTERNFADIEAIPNDYPFYTKSIMEEFPEIIEIFEQKEIFGINLRYCSLNIFKKVIGYSNIEIGKEINQGKKVFLNEPITYSYSTKGFIFRVPRPRETLEMISDEKEKVEMSGYHATEHVIIEGSSMLIGGASQDIGGISLGDIGMIVIHDGSIGGNGASKSLFDKFEPAIRRAYSILMECPCENDDGCPRCTYSYRCGNNNEYLHKKAAIEILSRIIKGEKIEIVDFERFQQTLI
ncbi:MAG TPA: DEAD/DEAH box helicase [Nitrososphaeraceae archaeon]|nr:DEAD/DEAH box helicase [Nitrososphaeraceae archaeon]